MDFIRIGGRRHEHLEAYVANLPTAQLISARASVAANICSGILISLLIPCDIARSLAVWMGIKLSRFEFYKYFYSCIVEVLTCFEYLMSLSRCFIFCEIGKDGFCLSDTRSKRLYYHSVAHHCMRICCLYRNYR